MRMETTVAHISLEGKFITGAYKATSFTMFSAYRGYNKDESIIEKTTLQNRFYIRVSYVSTYYDLKFILLSRCSCYTYPCLC